MISIHALLAESDQNSSQEIPPRLRISIHALLAESDDICFSDLTREEQFQSTLSLRRATSILWMALGGETNFNPRSPCGERPAMGDDDLLVVSQFQSTLSLRRATETTNRDANRIANFNPRSPCGERRKRAEYIIQVVRFQSTLSLRRATTVGKSYALPRNISIHALLAESDTSCPASKWASSAFQSTLSLRRATEKSRTE